ncbi:hypothetical protein CHS0354_024157 [Potamilus streckersoni]|uniref:Xylose isomerase-like TIM barrel domain-containing protein n=1 Tax=Potamilus streckersoni TaxID=2493646 RepID=A0AAE0RZT7_9BIVA|nr:hypothetical protein CHS0354_024157 [Potamilus streckersoni]
MAKDLKSTLKNLSDSGYKLIESFEYNNGENIEEKIARAGEVGIEYLIVPYVGPQKDKPEKTIDDYKRIAESFNVWGEMCKKNNVKLAYHNHDYSFTKLEGQYPQDIFMQQTDPNLVYFQMDIYWVITAGEDPVQWVKKYPNRFKLCHVKDRMSGQPITEKNASCVLGTGIIDFKKILPVLKADGMQYFIVEQERYDTQTPLESMRLNAEYMKKWNI